MKLLIKLYTIWVALVFLISMILLLPFIISSFLLNLKNKWISYKALWLWAKIFSIFTGIRYKARGLNNIPGDRACIIICNHTSYLDLPAMPLFLPEFKPLAKYELAKIPVFSLIVKSVAILVDRSDPQSRKQSVEKIAEVIKQGISVIIFPEGTRNRTENPLKPFYDGAFKLAIATRAPILPMVVINANNLLPPESLRIKPGVIKVKFAPLIEMTGYQDQDVKVLKERVYKIMEEMIKN